MAKITFLPLATPQPTRVGAAGQTERSGEVERSWLQSADTHSQSPQDPVISQQGPAKPIVPPSTACHERVAPNHSMALI